MKKKDNFENNEAVFEVIEMKESAQKPDEKETLLKPVKKQTEQASEPEQEANQNEIEASEQGEETTLINQDEPEQNDTLEETDENGQSEPRKPLDEIVKPTELDNIEESVVFDGEGVEAENIFEEEVSSDEDFLLDEFLEPEPQKGNKFTRWWKARKTWQKALMVSSISFVLVFAILFTIAMTAFDYNYNSISSNPTDLGFEEVIEENIVNIALFGLDTRSLKSFEGNSDSIMILSLNTKTKKVKITSVMRDTLVPITYNGKTTYGKINSAYAKGGPELAVKTLNTIFGLDISEYATVNFFGMVDIIDAVGGIEAELTQGEVTKNTNIRAINFCINELCKKLKLNAADYRIYTPGKQTLNGVQAVAYSRIRYVQNIWGTNNDYGRTDRQRYVMEQLFNKAITLDKSKYISLAKSLIPCSETSLSYSEIIDLAFGILLESPTFEQTRMPQEDFLMPSPAGRFGSVVYYDLDFAKNLIHEFIYKDVAPEKYLELNGIRKYDWYANRYTNNGSLSPVDSSDAVVVPPSNTDNNYVSSGDNTVTTTPDYNNAQSSTTPDTTVPPVSSDITTTDPSQTGNSQEPDANTSSNVPSVDSGTDNGLTSNNTSSDVQSGAQTGSDSNTSSDSQTAPDTGADSSAPSTDTSSDSPSSEPTVPDTEVSAPADKPNEDTQTPPSGGGEQPQTPPVQE